MCNQTLITLPIHVVTRKHLHISSFSSITTNYVQTTQASVTIPYIHDLSQSICRVLSPLIIKVTVRPFQTLKQELVHLKDPVPEKQRKGVMYSTASPAASAHGCTYIGQTGRTLDHRLAEHRWAPRRGCVSFSNCCTRVCCWPPGGSLKSHGNRHPPAWPDPLSSRVLAYPAWTAPPQWRKGNFTRTLCHLVGLTAY